MCRSFSVTQAEILCVCCQLVGDFASFGVILSLVLQQVSSPNSSMSPYRGSCLVVLRQAAGRVHARILGRGTIQVSEENHPGLRLDVVQNRDGFSVVWAADEGRGISRQGAKPQRGLGVVNRVDDDRG